ncbi:MAG: acyltransferase [Bacteroidetes bacterium]|nr:acyltransferase [Bacteroidota bacterium]
MKIGFFQFKPERGDVKHNAEKIYDSLIDKDFDLMVLPELANSGYLFANSEELESASENIPSGIFSQTLLELSKKKNAYIISGVCEKFIGEFFNSSVLYCPDGSYKIYRKLHLFDSEKQWFTAGNMPLEAYEIHLTKIGMMVCFDWIFPETARTLALRGAKIICHPSNLVMPYCQQAMFTRALENHVFTITANRIGSEKVNDTELFFTGESVIVSPRGEYLARASKDSEECIIVEINEEEAGDKNINPNNNLFIDRRMGFYEV